MGWDVTAGPDRGEKIRSLVAEPHGRLEDGFGRVHSYVRIAVNEVCNLRCIYCMPEEGLVFKDREELLTTREILRVLRVLTGLGVCKVRFTGGEPLLRQDIRILVEKAVATEGVESVHLTTNGIFLSDQAGGLRAAGLTGVNISLDTMNAARYLEITRRTGLERVLEGIHLAVDLGFSSVKVNTVVLRGFNEDELGDFVDLTRAVPITVRFIELMPFDSHQVWKRGHFFSADWIVESLKKAFPEIRNDTGTRTERHIYRIPGHAGKVAVIPAYTRTTCPDCNRIRITADGRIRNCLYCTREFDLKKILRSGGADEDVTDLFRTAMRTKLESGWDAQKRMASRTGEHPGNSVIGHRDSMTQIGG